MERDYWLDLFKGMNKKTLKTVIIVLILFLVGVGAVFGINAAKTYLSGAAAGEDPQNVKVQADVASATISWQSEKETMGVVEYGANQASLMLRAIETQKSTVHRVVLSPLKEGTTYYFRIKVGETIYDNNGIPYSFKTNPATVAELSPTPTAVAIEPVLPSPTTASESGVLVTTCISADFESQMGTSNSAYDFDKNGVVNTLDFIKCKQANDQ